MSVTALRSIRYGVLMVVVCICFGMFVGCGRNEPEKAEKVEKVEKTEKAVLAQRLEAAKKITFTEMRNNTLDALTVEAAQTGELEVVKAALKEISFINQSNNVAAKAADIFSANGDIDAATEVAEFITITEKRNEVLARIATSKTVK